MPESQIQAAAAVRLIQRETRFLHSQALHLSQFFCWSVTSHTHSQHIPPAVYVLGGKFHEPPSI